MSLVVLLALPFAGSVLAALLPTHARTLAASFAGLVALACAAGVAVLFPEVRAGGVVRESFAWMPGAGVAFTVRIDGFAWMFALLVTGIGALVALYARYYMSPADPVPRFFALFLAFMGAMLGVVLAGDLVMLAFFWELTSLVSFLLIGYWHHRADARRGARMALVVTGTGGLCLLAGVLVLGRIVGSYDLDAVLAAGERIRAHDLYPVALVLVLAGALSKSAQFPFHFWLPRAMAAPTPVSAYLHSATMVKAGVFLLARLWPALAGTEAWFWIVAGAGACTLLLCAYFAMFEHDLKGLLAYSTLSHLGLITLLLGLNSPLAAVAAVFHVMNHATFKASLFMAAGIVDHETGTRDLRRLSGLYRVMPITGTLALVASAAMAGVPLLNGFLSKEMFFAETLFLSAHPGVEWALPVIATLAGAFAVVYALRFSVDVFFGAPAHDLPREPHEPVRWMRLPIELLVLACLVVGIAPGWSVGPVLAAAAAPVVGGALPGYSLALWHGFNAPLAMSVVAMIVGILVWRRLGPRLRRGAIEPAPLLGRFDGARAFRAAMAAVPRAARVVLRWTGTARLQAQLAWVVVVAIAVVATAFVGQAFDWGDRPRVPAEPAFALMWAVGIACALGAAVQAKFHRLAALMLVAGAGLVTCITFAWFSAPDLALTQLAVEAVTTVLFLLGLRWLPQRLPRPGDRRTFGTHLRHVRDFMIALTSGAGLAALAYAMLTRTSPQSISPFYLQNALPGGGGTNVVNVILVDFRAFDTMGEITVLAAVALTVYALLRRFRPPRESAALPRQQDLPADLATDLASTREARDMAVGYLIVPSVLVRLVLPIAVVVAVHLFMRGHNQPGGGFVAGLVVAIALIAQYMVAGTRWVEARMNPHPARWIAGGLAIVVATGAGAFALGYPFLTTHSPHFDLPWLGEVHVPSALFFDLGVFATVIGAVLLVLIALAHQSIRAPARSGDAAGPR
ncbi:MAG: monovalent cation/H+ antiporter subunit A [Burkholderiales bacterium]|nr:monovalent cation/H+ antiporter subunit A [Burkholderiales bacterium]